MGPDIPGGRAMDLWAWWGRFSGAGDMIQSRKIHNKNNIIQCNSRFNGAIRVMSFVTNFPLTFLALDIESVSQLEFRETLFHTFPFLSYGMLSGFSCQWNLAGRIYRIQ